ncbi:MAG: acyloxyacyl hydrolase [Sedimentisphaerales bacterium]|nr:acyloxyacyl hydrolase [Sedimentisphaerales bacterium]
MILSGKYYHISNAGLDENNRGLDLFAISLGYRF